MRAGVVGFPATHSLSPAIHRAGYATHGLDWTYEAYTVAPQELDGFVRPLLDDPGWAGLSVTAPHKEAILAYGAADEPSQLVGGGNTLVLGGRPSVHNTDVPGFVVAWRAHRLPLPRRAAILGNGATARSIVVALAALGTRELLVLARRPERAQPLLDLARALGLECRVQPLDTPVEPVDVLASTIPAEATAPIAKHLADAAATVFDVVYDPWPTPLTSAAEGTGRQVLTGLDLLAGQAVDQFRLLTGATVTFDQCRSAAGRELSRRRAL